MKKIQTIEEKFNKNKLLYSDEDIDAWKKAAEHAETESQRNLLSKIINQYSDLTEEGYV